MHDEYYIYTHIYIYIYIYFKLEFTPCKAEQKKKHKKIKAPENLFRKNLQLIGICWF